MSRSRHRKSTAIKTAAKDIDSALYTSILFFLGNNPGASTQSVSDYLNADGSLSDGAIHDALQQMSDMGRIQPSGFDAWYLKSLSRVPLLEQEKQTKVGQLDDVYAKTSRDLANSRDAQGLRDAQQKYESDRRDLIAQYDSKIKEAEGMAAATNAIDLADLMAAYGSPSLKTLPDGWVEGCAVLFTDRQSKDLTGDYFSKNTLLEWEGKEKRSAMYHHGMDDTLKDIRVGAGWILDRIDDIGVWVKNQLNMRDEYESAIYDLAGKGKLGLSSGTASHMVKRAPDGELLSWPIVEISFTPTPAEPRTMVMPVKSMVTVPSFKSLTKTGMKYANPPQEFQGQKFTVDNRSGFMDLMNRANIENDFAIQDFANSMNPSSGVKVEFSTDYVYLKEMPKPGQTEGIGFLEVNVEYKSVSSDSWHSLPDGTFTKSVGPLSATISSRGQYGLWTGVFVSPQGKATQQKWSKSQIMQAADDFLSGRPIPKNALPVGAARNGSARVADRLPLSRVPAGNVQPNRGGSMSAKTATKSIDDLVASITQLVPDLNPDQIAAIQSVLTLALTPPETALASSPEEEAAEGEMMKSMSKTDAVAFKRFRLYQRMAIKALNIMDTLKQLVPGLKDEQYTAIESVIQLALTPPDQIAGTPAPAPAADPAAPQPAGSTTAMPAPPAAEVVKAAVAKALADMGIRPNAIPNRGPNARAAAFGKSAVPPYDFKPTQEDPKMGTEQSLMEIGKAINLLRYGAPEAAIKAVLTDLHGADYEQKRWDQWQAFNRYIRRYDRTPSEADGRLLSQVIMTPDVVAKAIQTGLDVRALKDTMVEAIGSLGGYLVPVDFNVSVIERLQGYVFMRKNAYVATTSRDRVEFPKATGGNSQYTSAVRVTWVDETPTAGAAATNLTFGLEAIGVHTVMAEVPLSRNLIEDSAFDLAGYLAEKFAEASGIDEDNKFLIGDGVGKPFGVLPGGANTLGLTETETTNANLLDDWDNLIDLSYSIDSQYRGNAMWLAAKATYSKIAKLKDGLSQYYWRRDNTAGQPTALLGYGLGEQESMPTVATGHYPMVFGDPKGYTIVDRIGATVERYLDSQTARQNLVYYVMRRRLGGKLMEPWRFGVLKVK